MTPDKIIKTGIPIPPVGEPKINRWAYVFNRRSVDESWGKYNEKVKRFYANIEMYFQELFYMPEIVGAKISFEEYDIDYVLDLSNGMCIRRRLPSLFFVHHFEKDLSWCLKDTKHFIEESYK